MLGQQYNPKTIRIISSSGIVINVEIDPKYWEVTENDDASMFCATTRVGHQKLVFDHCLKIMKEAKCDEWSVVAEQYIGAAIFYPKNQSMIDATRCIKDLMNIREPPSCCSLI